MRFGHECVNFYRLFPKYVSTLTTLCIDLLAAHSQPNPYPRVLTRYLTLNIFLMAEVTFSTYIICTVDDEVHK